MFRVYYLPALFLTALIAAATFYPEFVDLPSLLLTLGGALVVTFCSYSTDQLHELVRAIKGVASESISANQRIKELNRLTRLFRIGGLRALEAQEPTIRDDFLRTAVRFLVDLEREESLCVSLEREFDAIRERSELCQQILRTLGKLLPSFGLIGTLIGMVLLLRNIAGHDLAALPTAMSLAVLTTLYGAVFANVAVAPIAARLQRAASEEQLGMRLTMEWAIMLIRGETESKVQGWLNAIVPSAQVTSNSRWAAAVVPVES